jgi:uncharacterized protein (TIGR03000 family)
MPAAEGRRYATPKITVPPVGGGLAKLEGFRMHRVILVAAAIGCFLSMSMVAQSGTITVPRDRAILIVRVTADATVTVGGLPTNQKGAERTFTTPPLVPGYSYSYEFAARWTEDGKEQSSKRVVDFQAGEAKVVNLTSTTPAPRTDNAPKTAVQNGDKKRGAPKTRAFLFTYAGRVTDLKPGESARIWLPQATSNGQQDVAIASMNMPLGTAVRSKETDKQYGNAIIYIDGKANEKGEIPFEVVYKVLRRETQTDLKGNLYLQPAPGEKIVRYLEPDAKVPINGKPLEVLKENLKYKELPREPFAAARTLYDVVNQYMTYKKVGTGWGQGDVLWACDSRYGNCTDFHSLFISMARGNKIPAKFEMGFPLPPKLGEGVIPGYHCWAWFMPDNKGWIPVDISEANQHPDQADYYFGNLSENRVSFSIGRDIDLEPRQKGPALNFFIYPYVEVDGKTYPAEKVQQQFSYKDLP